MKMWVEQDVNRDDMRGMRVAVIGYGSQGRAHALNLRDSGFDVVVGLRAGGPSWKQAEADGMTVAAPERAVESAEIVALLVPDMAQPAVFESVAPRLRRDSAILFAHGFNIHYGRIQPPGHCDVILVAPKGPGDLVRRQYEAPFS